MRGEQAIFNMEIKKKSGLSINPDISYGRIIVKLLVFSFCNFGFNLYVIYIYKVVLSVCLFVCPIITHEPLD